MFVTSHYITPRYVCQPSKEAFRGNSEEINQLIESLDDDPIRIPVIIAAFYGLRRSEVLGIKWSAIDFDESVIRINHKIVNDGFGATLGLDVMKTKSSYRSLPLMPFIKDVLLAEKQHQDFILQSALYF